MIYPFISENVALKGLFIRSTVQEVRRDKIISLLSCHNNTFRCDLSRFPSNCANKKTQICNR